MDGSERGLQKFGHLPPIYSLIGGFTASGQILGANGHLFRLSIDDMSCLIEDVPKIDITPY
jgi:hypothetical protein